MVSLKFCFNILEEAPLRKNYRISLKIAFQMHIQQLYKSLQHHLFTDDALHSTTLMFAGIILLVK